MRVRVSGVRCAGWALCGLAAVMVLAGPRDAGAQTLARKGWAGSGMRVERWWTGAVIYEVRPGTGQDAGPSVLAQVAGRLDDLQALGVDAILLRDVDGVVAGAGAAPLRAEYGSLEEFDGLMSEASRRRLRVLVEVSGSGEVLTSRARFWLSRGVTGLYLSGPGDARAGVRALRGVLRGFVGERVLLGDAAAFAAPDVAQAAPGRRRSGRTARAGAGSAKDAPDLLLRELRGLGGAGVDVGAVRASLEAAARAGAGDATVTELAGAEAPGSEAEARAEVTALLSVRGGVALRAAEVGFVGAAEPRESASVPGAAADSLSAWTSRMVGLHRGNATMRDGAQTLLNHDAEGALVVVWRGGGARAQVLVEIVNLTAKPLSLSLTEEIAGLRLRGSFLRTVLRSDEGMGAMPLRAVQLAGYGVYLGELGR